MSRHAWQTIGMFWLGVALVAVAMVGMGRFARETEGHRGAWVGLAAAVLLVGLVLLVASF